MRVVKGREGAIDAYVSIEVVKKKVEDLPDFKKIGPFLWVHLRVACVVFSLFFVCNKSHAHTTHTGYHAICNGYMIIS